MTPPPPDLRVAGGGGVTATRRQAALGTRVVELFFALRAAVSDGSLVTTTVDYRFCVFGLGRRQPTGDYFLVVVDKDRRKTRKKEKSPTKKQSLAKKAT